MVTPTREQALAAAGAWAKKHGMRARSFARAVERIEPIAGVFQDASGHATDRDSLTGMAVVEAPLGEASAPAAAPAAIPHYRVYYRLATGTGSVDVRGYAGQCTADGDAQAIKRRSIARLACAAVGLTAAFGVWREYLARHAWFKAHGANHVVLGCGVVAALAVTWLVSEWLMGRAARRAGHLVASGLVIVATISLAVWRATVQVPTMAHSLSLFAHGQTDAAMREADAFDATHPGDRGSAVDALHLAMIPPHAQVDELVALMRQPWRRQDARARVFDQLRRTANERARDIVASRERGRALLELFALVQEFMPEQRLPWDGRAAMLDARGLCFAPEPDVFCLQRQEQRAHADGVPDAETTALEIEFLEVARAWARARWAHAQRLPPGWERTEALMNLEAIAGSVQRQLHQDPGVDLAAVHRERDAGGGASDLDGDD